MNEFITMEDNRFSSFPPTKRKGTPQNDRPKKAFSLVELLVVIAIIAILASLVVSRITNASLDSSQRIADQQQAALQQALNAWAVATASTSSLSATRTAYTASTNKLALISNYLDPKTYEHFTESASTATQIKTEALTKIGGHLTFGAWSSATNYPIISYQATTN